MTDRRIVRTAAIAFAAVVAGWGCAHAPRLVVLHDPLSIEEHLALGVAYEREGNRSLARAEYEAVLRRRPDHVPAMVNLGNLAAAEGSRRDAEAWYHRALRVGGKEAAPAANNLAWLYLEQRKQLRVATSLARKAVAWDPRPAYVDTLARVLIARSKPREAAEAVREAEAKAGRATTLHKAAAP